MTSSPQINLSLPRRAKKTKTASLCSGRRDQKTASLQHRGTEAYLIFRARSFLPDAEAPSSFSR